MRVKVESHEAYEEASTNLDPILLLKMIKSIVFDFQERKYIYSSVSSLHEQFVNFKQHPNTSVSKYKEKYQDLNDTLRDHRIDLCRERILLENDD